MKDEFFSWDEGCKVSKIFPGNKESSSEEEGKLSLSGSSEEEEGELRFSGKSEEEEEVESNGLEHLARQEDDSMGAKKHLDPDFLLKIDLMLISFSAEFSFFEEIIFFHADVFSVLSERYEESLQYEEVSKVRASFLIEIFPFQNDGLGEEEKMKLRKLVSSWLKERSS